MEISLRQKLQLQKPVFNVVRDLEVFDSKTEHKVQTKLFPSLYRFQISLNSHLSYCKF